MEPNFLILIYALASRCPQGPKTTAHRQTLVRAPKSGGLPGYRSTWRPVDLARCSEGRDDEEFTVVDSCSSGAAISSVGMKARTHTPGRCRLQLRPGASVMAPGEWTLVSLRHHLVDFITVGGESNRQVGLAAFERLAALSKWPHATSRRTCELVTCLSVCLPACLSVCLSLSVSVCVCLSVCLPRLSLSPRPSLPLFPSSARAEGNPLAGIQRIGCPTGKKLRYLKFLMTCLRGLITKMKVLIARLRT